MSNVAKMERARQEVGVRGMFTQDDLVTRECDDLARLARGEVDAGWDDREVQAPDGVEPGDRRLRLVDRLARRDALRSPAIAVVENGAQLGRQVLAGARGVGERHTRPQVPVERAADDVDVRRGQRCREQLAAPVPAPDELAHADRQGAQGPPCAIQRAEIRVGGVARRPGQDHAEEPEHGPGLRDPGIHLDETLSPGGDVV